MLSINLYQPKLYDKQIEFAENWNELLPAELEAIAASMLAPDENIFFTKASMLCTLLSIRAEDPELPLKLDPEDCALFGMNLVDFIFDSSALTKQPYPLLEVPGNMFQAPADHFDTIQTAEYEEAFIHYLNFKTDNDSLHLAKLAAVLYRPKGKKFVTYNVQTLENDPYQYDHLVPAFQHIGNVKLFVIFMWFTGCQALLQQIFWNVYSEGESNSEPDLLVFTKCIHAAAGPKNGTRDHIRRMPLKELLFDMEQESIKQKELEVQMKAQTK